jgi:CheY-like chemotaxis protein
VAATARSVVVEDNDESAALVRLLLEAEGFSVLRVTNAEDALLLAPQQALTLITLDLHLPGINGWAFLRRMRENSTLAHVPVVIVSGDPVNSLALNHGAAAMLQKPFGRAQLQASLANLGLGPTQQHVPSP